MSRTGRPKGSRNAKPSQKAIQGYYALLRDAADQGDINAAGWLVSITEQTQVGHMPAASPTDAAMAPKQPEVHQ